MAYRIAFQKTTAAALTVSLIVLAGCASTRGSNMENIAGLTVEQVAAMPAAQRAVLSQRLEMDFQRYPGNAENAIAYAEFLKAEGQFDKANDVMKTAAGRNPGSASVQLYFAKSQAAIGNYPDALRTSRRAAQLAPNDWRTYSQEGLILDQMGKPMDARMAYRKALSLSRNNPEVLSNMATSYVLTHDLVSAEGFLRDAVKQRDADPDVRVNLALVLALQGKRDEAQRVATAAVSSEQAARNLAALNAATAPGGAWEQYSAGM